MDNLFVLIFIGFVIGTFGTLIGAGGGFILVPLLILTHPKMPPAIITAISIAVVAVNAISGSIAYARSKRIDYRAGIMFSVFTIPGSVIGVFLTRYIPINLFNFVFGVLLIMLASYLFIKTRHTAELTVKTRSRNKGLTHHILTDSHGDVFSYSYYQPYGIVISILVGFLSPLLGIGGGIIHVPAMVQWLSFPVYVATATSHFILAVMSAVSVIVHIFQGSYNDPSVLRMVAGLCIGVTAGAQLGAYLSYKIKTHIIIRVLAISIAVVGLRIIL